MSQSIIAAQEASKALDRILGRAFQYAERKRLSRSVLEAYFRCNWDEYPQNWEDLAMGMLVAGTLFCDARNASGFVRGEGDSLDREALTLARIWRQVPWHYLVLDLSPADSNNLMSTTAAGRRPSSFAADKDWPEIQVYSRGLADFYRLGARRVLGLFWFDGALWQSYGPLIPLTHLVDENDLSFFSSVVKNRNIPAKARSMPTLQDTPPSLHALVHSDPIPWLRLFGISETPVLQNPRYTLGLFAAAGTVMSRNPAGVQDIESDLKSRLKSAGCELEQKEMEGALKIIPRLAHRHADMSAVYLDSGTLYLRSMARESYSELREILAGLCDLPEEPQLSVNLVLYSHVEREFILPERFFQLERLFDAHDSGNDAGAAPGDSGLIDRNAGEGSLAELNQAASLLMDAFNSGSSIEDAEILARINISPDTLISLRSSLQESFSRMGIDDSPGPFDLAPKEVHALTKVPVPDVPGCFSLAALDSIDDLGFSHVPLMMVLRQLSVIAEKEGLERTPAGYFKPSVVAGLVAGLQGDDFGLYGSEYRRESDWYWLQKARKLFLQSGLLRAEKKSFVLSEELLSGPASVIYRRLFESQLRSGIWTENPHFESDEWLSGAAPLLVCGMARLSGGDEGGMVDPDELTMHIARYVPGYRRLLKENPGADPGKLDSPLGHLRYSAIGMFLSWFARPLGLVITEGEEFISPVSYTASEILHRIGSPNNEN